MVRYPYLGSSFQNTDLSRYERGLLRQLYRDMLRIRMVEEEIERRYPENEMKTPIHLVIGQEAGAVGACAALERTDLVYCGHRTHGVYLAKGGGLKAMLAELYCRADGCVRSRGGSMHLMDPDVGMAGASAIVGGAIAIATGAALAAHLREERRLTGVFFGDAALEEGVFWESANFAVLKRLPILYFCENNFYSVCTPLSHRQPSHVTLTGKVAAMGMPAERVDATNVVHVYEASRRAAEHARTGRGPYFLELVAYRWRAHGGAGDDSDSGYRDQREVEEWVRHCPVRMFGEALLKAGLVERLELEDWAREFNTEIAEAFAYAIASPEPDLAELLAHVYSPEKTEELTDAVG